MIATISVSDLVSNYPNVFFVYTATKSSQPDVLTDRTREMTGFKAGTFYRFSDWQGYLHPDDLSEYLLFSENQHDPEFSHITFRVLDQNQKYISINQKRIWLSLNNEPSQLNIFYKEPRYHTNKKKTQQKQSQRFQSFFDSINYIIFQTDQNGNWLFLNECWKRVLGYSIEESIGKPFINYLHPDDVEKQVKLFDRSSVQEENNSNKEIRYLTKSGKVAWLKFHAFPLKDDQGFTIGTTGTMQDVSEDRLNRNMLELLSNNIDDLVCLLEVDGTYKYVSPSSLPTTGYTPEELIGTHPYIYFHPDDMKQLHVDNFHMLDFEEIGELYTTHRFRLKSGAYRWLETSTKALKDDNDILIGLVTSSRVIDTRKNAEEQLLKSLQKEQDLNQLKSSFVSLASHEFRTPLACIRSSVELLEMAAANVNSPPSTAVKHINNIFSEVDRLTLLIDEVLTVGKIDTNNIGCKKERIKVVDMIKDILLNSGKVKGDTRKIKLTVEGRPRYTMADPLLLHHSITNLVTNALKYSTGKKAPVVTLAYTNENYTIKVKDYGIGIPFNDNKIFEAFHRAENAYSIQGTGLGMFIARNFIELHGGTITFESVINEGCEFVITLN